MFGFGERLSRPDIGWHLEMAQVEDEEMGRDVVRYSEAFKLQVVLELATRRVGDAARSAAQVRDSRVVHGEPVVAHVWQGASVIEGDSHGEPGLQLAVALLVALVALVVVLFQTKAEQFGVHGCSPVVCRCGVD